MNITSISRREIRFPH